MVDCLRKYKRQQSDMIARTGMTERKYATTDPALGTDHVMNVSKMRRTRQNPGKIKDTPQC